LLAATKDANARVRARAVTSLAATKDATLADTYAQLLNDQSYGVIRAATLALGQTKSVAAYDALVKLIDQPSWRGTIRASALGGLAALGDKRALALGFKYASVGNPANVRAAALTLVGSTGKDDPRTFDLLSTALNQAAESRNFAQMFGAAEALVALGDPRGLTTFQDVSKKLAGSPLANALSQFEARLRAKLAPAKPGG
jgi:HEAT repeat protein